MSNFPSLHEILTKLISFESVTPYDNQCQNYMIELLESIGFKCQIFNNSPVSNFYAQYGKDKPLIVFAGHTDVVPSGPLELWQSHPFTLSEKNGYYYGRGVADMKGSLACMLVAAYRFIQSAPANISIGFLITSGEEGNDYQLGTPYVMQQLTNQNIKIDYCIVGEPSSENKVGDTIKIGRRGSLNGKIVLHGKQGHVAYPHLAINPIHKIIPALNELVATVWDAGNEQFPPTSFQITQIKASGESSNVIPESIECHFNLRYSTQHTEQSIKEYILNCFHKYQLTPTIQWVLSGKPFLTASGKLLEETINVIQNLTQQSPNLSTNGGTSDGRFIAPYNVEVIELGPVNKTIHQINECVLIEDLNVLVDLYLGVLQRL